MCLDVLISSEDTGFKGAKLVPLEARGKASLNRGFRLPEAQIARWRVSQCKIETAVSPGSSLGRVGKDVMKELLKVGSGAISFVLILRLRLQAESSLAEVLKHRCANMQKKLIQANHLCKQLLAAVTSYS